MMSFFVRPYSRGTFPVFYKAVSEDLTNVMKEELSTGNEGATAENVCFHSFLNSTYYSGWLHRRVLKL